MKEEIEGISRIGFIGVYEIYINTDDEKTIPHFHIRNLKDNFSSSICIEKAEYCLHDGAVNTLNTEMKLKLQDFLRQPIQFLNADFSYWECICLTWDVNNPKSQINAHLQPDYNLL